MCFGSGRCDDRGCGAKDDLMCYAPLDLFFIFQSAPPLFVNRVVDEEAAAGVY